MEPNQVYPIYQREVLPWNNSGQTRCFTVKMMVAFLAWQNASGLWFDLVWFFLKIYRGLKYNFIFSWSSISLTESVVDRDSPQISSPLFFYSFPQNSTIWLLYCPLLICFLLLFITEFPFLSSKSSQQNTVHRSILCKKALLNNTGLSEMELQFSIFKCLHRKHWKKIVLVLNTSIQLKKDRITAH